MVKLFLLIAPILFASTVFAHSGRTDAAGCHNDRKHGGYHCHNSKSKLSENREVASQDKDVVFNEKTKKMHRPNCKAAKACTVNCVTIKRSEAIRRNGVACGSCGG